MAADQDVPQVQYVGEDNGELLELAPDGELRVLVRLARASEERAKHRVAAGAASQATPSSDAPATLPPGACQ